MTSPAKVRLFSRLRARMRSALVMDAGPEMLALDAELRASEKRLPKDAALVLLLGLSIASWAGIIALVRALL